MNILISGIHGFVGSNLVEALKGQHTIYGLDIVSPAKAGVVKTYGWQELEQIKSADVIIHLAGKAHDTKNTTEEKAYFDINVGLTQKIFEHFLKSNATKFIFFSSVKAVADNVSGDYLTEEVVPNPQTAYGKSKLTAEQYILNQSEVGSRKWKVGSRKSGVGSRKSEVGSRRSSGFGLPPIAIGVRTPVFGLRTSDKKVYILRPCMIHGPGNKGNLNLLYKLVQKGIPWPLGAFKNRRSFTSIGNLAFVISQIIGKEIEPGIYQMADDEPLSTNQLIRMISESKGRKARIWKINKKIIERVARMGDFLHLPLNSERFTLWN